MHPLELFDRFRRWFDWVAPGRQLWERKPEQVAPDRSDDWLLEPPSLEEARLLFPQLLESCHHVCSGYRLRLSSVLHSSLYKLFYESLRGVHSVVGA